MVGGARKHLHSEPGSEDHTWISEVQHEALWNFYPLPA